MRLSAGRLARLIQLAIMETRTEKIIAYLRSRKDLIDQAPKGKIEVSFKSDSIMPSILIMDDNQ